MSEILVTKLNAGAGTLLERAIDLFGVDIHSFIIGDDFNFTPNANETGPRGNITFNGDRSLVKIKMFDNEMSMRVSLIIPEEYDSVDIGNIVIYAFSQGQVKPVISMVLPNLVVKKSAFPELEGSVKFKYPSSRLVVSFTIKYLEQTPFDNVTLNMISPEFANLHMFGHSDDVPAGNVNPHQQFIVNQMDGVGGAPAFVVKDNINSYWTTPLWQDINSPKYGVLDGGVEGDGYIIERMKWLWGGWFITPDENFTALIQGGDFESTDPSTIDLGFQSF